MINFVLQNQPQVKNYAICDFLRNQIMLVAMNYAKLKLCQQNLSKPNCMTVGGTVGLSCYKTIVSRGSNKSNAHNMNHIQDFDSNLLTSEYKLSRSKSSWTISRTQTGAVHATGSIAAPVSSPFHCQTQLKANFDQISKFHFLTF